MGIPITVGSSLTNLAAQLDSKIQQSNLDASKQAQEPDYYFLDSSDGNYITNSKVLPLRVIPRNRFGASNFTSRTHVIFTSAYAWIAHGDCTRFNSANPTGTPQAASGVFSPTAPFTIANALGLPHSLGNYLLAAIGARFGLKHVNYDFEPNVLVGPDFGVNRIDTKYPFTLVPGTYAPTLYTWSLPHGFSEVDGNVERDARLAVIQKMHQFFANSLIPWAIEPALDPLSPACGAEISVYDCPFSLFQEGALQNSNLAVAQSWVDRSDLIIDQRVEFPPPPEWIAEPNPDGGYYDLPLGKTAADYEFINSLGPGRTKPRLVDLLKATGGTAGHQMYVLTSHNLGGVGSWTNWDDIILRQFRRLAVYHEVRDIPITFFIRPGTRDSLDPWVPGQFIANPNVTKRAIWPLGVEVDGVPGDGLEHDWRPKISSFTTEATFAEDLALDRWWDLGRTGRMLRPEILRPMIAELRFRYGNRWQVFGMTEEFDDFVYTDEWDPFIQAEMTKPVMSSLDDLALPLYGAKPYLTGTNPDYPFPNGIVL